MRAIVPFNPSCMLDSAQTTAWPRRDSPVAVPMQEEMAEEQRHERNRKHLEYLQRQVELKRNRRSAQQGAAEEGAVLEKTALEDDEQAFQQYAEVRSVLQALM